MAAFTQAWLFLLFYSLLPGLSRTITLSCFRLNSAPTNLYQNFSEVMVDCSHHRLVSREDLFFHKSQLCKTTPNLCALVSGFDYRYNSIRDLEKPRFDFPLITKLLFDHNQIEVIGDDAFSTGELEYLDLNHNKITGETLRKAAFRGKFNKTTGIYEDSSIQKLYLAFNKISYLKPDSFFYLKRLTTLHLNNNPLTVIGDATMLELQSLPHLYVLHLGSINASALPDSMFSNTSLDTLYLNGNKFTQVPNLKPLGHSLLNLNLDNNQFRELNSNSFAGLRYLNTLNISANSQLQAIWKNTFRPLINLLTLYCNFNPKLSHIHAHAFNNDWSLREFYINNNALTVLAHELGDWDGLEVLDIQSNPWSCDCSILWLIDYVASRQKTDPELNSNLHCSQPPEYSGEHLLSNPILSHISGECVKGSLAISKLSDHYYKFYPLLFVMSLLLLTLVTYVIVFTYRYVKSHVPYTVCNYTVHYNKLSTNISSPQT